MLRRRLKYVNIVVFLWQSKAPSPPTGAVAPTVASAGTTQSTKKKKAVEDEDLIARQERLQAEATMALAQVSLRCLTMWSLVLSKISKIFMVDHWFM